MANLFELDGRFNDAWLRFEKSGGPDCPFPDRAGSNGALLATENGSNRDRIVEVLLARNPCHWQARMLSVLSTVPGTGPAPWEVVSRHLSERWAASVRRAELLADNAVRVLSQPATDDLATRWGKLPWSKEGLAEIELVKTVQGAELDVLGSMLAQRRSLMRRGAIALFVAGLALSLGLGVYAADRYRLTSVDGGLKTSVALIATAIATGAAAVMAVAAILAPKPEDRLPRIPTAADDATREQATSEVGSWRVRLSWSLLREGPLSGCVLAGAVLTLLAYRVLSSSGDSTRTFAIWLAVYLLLVAASTIVVGALALRVPRVTTASGALQLRGWSMSAHVASRRETDQVLALLHETATQYAHREATRASRWARVQYWVGIPASLLASFGGVSAVSQRKGALSVVLGLIGLLGSGLTAVTATLNSGREAQGARIAEAAYTALSREIEVARQLETAETSPEADRASVNDYLRRLNELAGVRDALLDAPGPGRKGSAARRGSTAGRRPAAKAPANDARPPEGGI